MVRHDRQVHAELLGDGGIRLAGMDLHADESRHVERAQTVALLAFGDLRVAISGQFADSDRNLLQRARIAARSRLAPKRMRCRPSPSARCTTSG